jgi:hypothetical protein
MTAVAGVEITPCFRVKGPPEKPFLAMTRISKWISSMNTDNHSSTRVRQNLRTIHQNIQYSRNKIDQISVFLQETTPDVLALSEHGLSETEITQCKIAGYTILFYFCRSKHEAGGNALYISHKIMHVKALKWIVKKHKKPLK